MVPTDANSTIIVKTRELCQTILDEPGYQHIRTKIETFMGDSAAQTQYQAVVEKGNMLQHKQQTGSPLSGEEITDFEKDRDALLSNDVAKDFLEAQESLQKIQTSVQQYVSKTFELGRVPKEDDFEGGSCGEGCGCD